MRFEVYTSLGDGECRRIIEKINLCHLYSFIAREPTQIVITSGESVPCHCHLFPVLKQSLGSHEFKNICYVETCAIMAGNNKTQAAVSRKQKSSSHDMLNAMFCDVECVEK